MAKNDNDCEVEELPLFIEIKSEQFDEEDSSLEEFYEVEYLDENELTQDIIYEPTPHPEVPKKSKKKRRRRRTLYTYTQQELAEAVERVRNKDLKISQAVTLYNIPRATIKGKLCSYGKPVTKQMRHQEKQCKLVRELQNLLSYTNAVPFKAKTGKFYCAYCSAEGPFFDEADALRSHTIAEHSSSRATDIPKILKPFNLNEIVKVDISNLKCTFCCTPLLSWNQMFEHLKSHDTDFDEAYKRVVPFLLGEKMKCALCDCQFDRFSLLDAHMNCHYKNHICPECGDTFLSASRLSRHAQRHDRGRFPCEECGKVFSLDKYRVKHRMYVHRGEMIFKCLYCKETFKTDYARHQHLCEVHCEKVKMLKCIPCDKQYTYRPFYLKHMKRKHKDDADKS